MATNHSDENLIMRLEFIFDDSTDTAWLQGNRRGLLYLRELIDNLTDSESEPGSHHHFDNASNLTKSNMNLVIRLLDEEMDN